MPRSTLGDMTANVASRMNSADQGKPILPVLKPSRTDAAGALGHQAMAIDALSQISTSGDALMLTPKCLEDMDDDAGDSDDPQQVAEYVRDIYGMLSREEVSFAANPEYLETQPDINAKM